MAIRKIDHVNIRTPRLEETIRFYVDMLGMKATFSPGATDMSRSAWLCDERGDAAIHVGSSEVSYPGDEAAPASAGEGSGRVHHVAFECSDHGRMLDWLRQCDQEVRLNDVPEAGLRQIFVRDPNDILVELNFR